MTTEFLKATDKFEGGMVANTGAGETAKATGQYFIECFDKDGNLKWRDETHNHGRERRPTVHGWCGSDLDHPDHDLVYWSVRCWRI